MGEPERVIEMQHEFAREAVADRRREFVSRSMWLLGISAIAAGVGLRAGIDCALMVVGGLIWGEYFVGGLVELLVSRRGAK